MVRGQKGVTMGKYYIAYGSNLNVMQMRVRCAGARIAGQALLANWQLMFRGLPHGAYLTIEPKDGAAVPVVIWALTGRNEEALDWYEGYPRLYHKRELEVPYQDRKTGRLSVVPAFVYIMRDGMSAGLPSSSYMECCMDGYTSFGFDTHYLVDAYNMSKEEMKNEKEKYLSLS